MTLKEARELRDRIIDDEGVYCTVPCGHGPDGYFARIYSSLYQIPAAPVDFRTWEEWEAYKADSHARRAKGIGRPKSPIEALIDRACGITEYSE